MTPRVTTDLVAPGVERIALRTPTLPPATHTNSYLVGERDFVAVEPASPWPAEAHALALAVRERRARGHRLLGAVVTHHHRDHTGGAVAFRKTTGVGVRGHPITRAKLPSGVLDATPVDEGDPMLAALGVEVLHTPGHAPGHVCLWSPAHRWLIAGDMVASVGTILIDPSDDGDMSAYLQQLKRLIELNPRRLLPAHGDPIEPAVAHLEGYVRHRLAREARVLDAVGATEVTGLMAIVARAYADTPPTLWPLAARSARAHLLRLARRGEVEAIGQDWRRHG